MDKYLAKAMNLVRRTGDRLVVYDSAKRLKPVVIMDIDEYEAILEEREDWDDDFEWADDLTDEPYIDRINRETAPRVRNRRDDFIPFPEVEAEPVDYGFDTEDSAADIDPAFDPDSVPGQSAKRKTDWSIPNRRKAAAETVEDEDDDEETQYLEEVRF